MTGEHLSPDMQDLLVLLARHGVRYLIVGGEAVIFHGHARLTGDIDLYFDQTPENVQRLHEALEDFWDGDIPGGLSPEDLSEPSVVVQFGRPPNRVDLLSDLGGIPFEQAWSGRVEDSMDSGDTSITIHYIGLAELLEAKRRAGRLKDLDDIENLTGD